MRASRRYLLELGLLLLAQHEARQLVVRERRERARLHLLRVHSPGKRRLVCSAASGGGGARSFLRALLVLLAPHGQRSAANVGLCGAELELKIRIVRKVRLKRPGFLHYQKLRRRSFPERTILLSACTLASAALVHSMILSSTSQPSLSSLMFVSLSVCLHARAREWRQTL